MPDDGDTAPVAPIRGLAVSQHVHLRIRRSDGWADFHVEVRRGAYVLEALEAAWRSDHTLLFRHSCHHGSCGTCGMRINGREALACLTPVADVARGGRPVRLEPLRNLALLGDLLVDMRAVAAGIERTGLPSIRRCDRQDGHRIAAPPLMQYDDCIECGLCVSACPIAGSDDRFVGPAVLAAGGRLAGELPAAATMAAMQEAGGEHGVWRCHGAFECSDVCPAEVDPARMILGLRRKQFQGSPAGGRE
jgi:succinate dehydrogenase / fumarate reductase iron-sulfur subunit